ncbi:MAG: hypothetical protein JXA90_06500 [Planctomycetes bacterium]|nr:hypothetical protein [Planctomycetota bacterium]
MQDTDDVRYEAEPRKRRGCFLYGCLGLVVLLLVAFGLIRWGIGKLLDRFTERTPRELQVVEMAEEEVQELKERWRALVEALEKGEPAEPLVLTARDINGLIQNSPDWSELRGKAYIDIDEQNRIRGEVSIPLDDFPFAKGRYFNGSAAVDVSLENGVLIVTLTGAEVKGSPLPDEFLQQLRGQNLAKDLYQEKDAAEKLRRLERIEVRDRQIVIIPRPPQPEAPRPPEPEEPPQPEPQQQPPQPEPEPQPEAQPEPEQ